MPSLLTTVLALALAAAPAPERGQAWIDDAATQLLARAMVEEARARDPQARPTHADLERALARCLDDVDNLMLLSGLMPLAREPEPLRRAKPRVISSRDPSGPSSGL